MILRLLIILLLIFIVYRIIRFAIFINRTADQIKTEFKRKHFDRGPSAGSDEKGRKKDDVIELSEDEYEVK